MKSRKTTQALTNLIEHTSCGDEIWEFLTKNGVIAKEAYDTLTRRSDLPAFIYQKLFVEKTNVDMVSITWNILPKEFIKLTIVTPMEYKEYQYDEV